MKKQIASLVLITTIMICLSLFKTSAQENALVIYETNDFISTVRWHPDGYTLSFEDLAQFGPNSPSWRLYDTLSGDMTTAPQWPLQPVLSSQQMNAFEINEWAALNLCPTGRLIAYSGREDAMFHGFLSIADLSAETHIGVTQLGRERARGGHESGEWHHGQCSVWNGNGRLG
ncbi:hypothetical protein ANRL4_02802 [Anaerolineae bacterium]|nr:hypothetical protein ANRL4_02802 [Anaerolineae bacterium]